MKVPFYLTDGSVKRAIVSFKGDQIKSLICDGFSYSSNESFMKAYDYATFVTSNEEVKEFLSIHGFIVRDSGRVNMPVHIAFPMWVLKKLDQLCKDNYFNYSRSDLINDILYKGLDHCPATQTYEKKRVRTSVTLNPVVLMKLETQCDLQGCTKNHLIYDYVMEYLEGMTDDE